MLATKFHIHTEQRAITVQLQVVFSPSTYVRICGSTAEIRISVNSASENARRHISWKTQKWWWNMGRTRRNTFLRLLLNGIEQLFSTFFTLCFAGQGAAEKPDGFQNEMTVKPSGFSATPCIINQDTKVSPQ